MSDTAVADKSVVIEAWNPPIDWVRSQIEKAGTKIGSVWFTKRETGELRKMSYRLHVTNPSFAKAPKGVSTKTDVVSITLVPKIKEPTTIEVCTQCKLPRRKVGETNSFNTCNVGPWTTIDNPHYVAPVITPVVNVASKLDKKVIDKANNQMTVLDANKVVRDESTGKVIGRGAWRTVPLENVTRIKANGTEIKINRY